MRLCLPTPVSRAGGERGDMGQRQSGPPLPPGVTLPLTLSPPDPQQVTHCSIMQQHRAEIQGNVLTL